MTTPWPQNYDPLGNPLLSTAVAAIPVAVLLGAIAVLHIRIHIAAFIGLVSALAIAIGVNKMPVDLAAATTAYGAAFGLFPIGWIILNVLFLYQLTVDRGLFEVLRASLARVAPDARVQLILIAFAFGAFLEGMAGFGTPVAITAAILIQLGFKPLHASGLSLIANTAPVAFGSLGIPITTLEQVTGIDAHLISAMVGRQLPFFFAPHPVLDRLGVRGLEGRDWRLARSTGCGKRLRHSTIRGFELPWSLAGGPRCRSGLHHRHGLVFTDLETARNHATERRSRRVFHRRSLFANFVRGRRAHKGADLPSVDAVDYTDSLHFVLGPSPNQAVLGQRGCS